MLIVADANPAVVARSLGELRLTLGRQLGLIRPDVHALCWVVEFPLLEWSAEEGRWTAMHHPFTSAMDEDWALLETDPGRVRAKAYDMVMDGWEVGGGSIRIHRREQQQAMFRALGIGPEEAEEKFGHLLEAFEYGAPPHGGIATGIDRTVAILAGSTQHPRGDRVPQDRLGHRSDVPLAVGDLGRAVAGAASGGDGVGLAPFPRFASSRGLC